MTKSDELMLSAVRMRTELSVNGRVVKVEGDRVTVSLYDVPIVTMEYAKRQVVVQMDIPVTRKSAKVVNAILKAYTDCKVRSLSGTWLLERRKGESLPLGRCQVAIPITKEEIPCSELEEYVF